MGFRHTRFRRLCAVCDQDAEHGCQRCGLPLCRVHRPERGARCQSCELDYAHRERLLPVLKSPTGLSERTHGRFFKALSLSAGLGLVGMVALGFIPWMSWLFFLGAMLSVFLIPAAWALAAATQKGANLAGDRFARMTHNRSRKKFLRERRVKSLPPPPDPDPETGPQQ